MLEQPSRRSPNDATIMMWTKIPFHFSIDRVGRYRSRSDYASFISLGFSPQGSMISINMKKGKKAGELQ